MLLLACANLTPTSHFSNKLYSGDGSAKAWRYSISVASLGVKPKTGAFGSKFAWIAATQGGSHRKTFFAWLCFVRRDGFLIRLPP